MFSTKFPAHRKDLRRSDQVSRLLTPRALLVGGLAFALGACTSNNNNGGNGGSSNRRQTRNFGFARVNGDALVAGTEEGVEDAVGWPGRIGRGADYGDPPRGPQEIRDALVIK